MLRVNIGGVPEHFNYPWYLALRSGAFKDQNINLRWKDCYGGTGEMCKALRSGTIDLAVILTEGIVKDITEGNPSKIVQTYVKSPLIWGIHVSSKSPYESVNDLKGTKAAISRYGSGSHLMAYVNAEKHLWDLDMDLKFQLVNDLNGGVKALGDKSADYFLWESFTTKPFVDQGIFRKIGDCPTPWPCFVIAVRENFINDHPYATGRILDIINSHTVNFKSISNIDKSLSSRYEQKLEDIQSWLELTTWSQNQIDIETIDTVQSSLVKLGIITNPLAPFEFTTNLWK